MGLQATQEIAVRDVGSVLVEAGGSHLNNSHPLASQFSILSSISYLLAELSGVSNFGLVFSMFMSKNNDYSNYQALMIT